MMMMMMMMMMDDEDGDEDEDEGNDAADADDADANSSQVGHFGTDLGDLARIGGRKFQRWNWMYPKVRCDKYV